MKPFISSETIATISKDVKEHVGAIEPYPFHDSDVFAVGMIRITATPTTIYMTLPSEVNGKYMSEWNNDVGKLLSRTLKKKQFNLIYVFNTPKYKALLRLVDPSEYLDMKERGFVHFDVGDNSYTIIRVVPADGSFAFVDRNDFDLDEYAQEEDDDDEVVTYDKSVEEIPESLSLY